MQEVQLTERVKYMHGDNMDLLRSLPDNSFDWAITDPPYFSGPEKRKFYGSEVSSHGVKRTDYPVCSNWEVPNQEYFEELFRVSKNQIIWGCNYFDYPFGPGRIIWDKINGNPSYSDCEIAFCSKHFSVRQFRFLWHGMMQGSGVDTGHIMNGRKHLNEKRIHQTQKPIALYQWIYRKYVKDGESVIDTHLGSGSSGIAAHFEGVGSFVGIEIEQTHFDNAASRFEEYLKDYPRFEEVVQGQMEF